MEVCSLEKGKKRQACGQIINMRGHEGQKISAHIPISIKEKWLGSHPQDQTNFVDLGLGWTVKDILDHIPERTEAGGVLFPTGISRNLGDETSVFAASGICTWHSHTQAPCQFSSQDWCSFILSNSVWSLLITPGHYRFYTKCDIQLVSECRTHLLGYSQKLPSVELMGRRLKKYALKKVPAIMEDLEADIFCKAFARVTGIEISPEYSL